MSLKDNNRAEDDVSVLPTADENRTAAVEALQSRGISEKEYPRQMARAIEAGDCELLGLLIAAGADVNAASKKKGISPLMRAVHCGRADVVKLLLAVPGIDVNQARHCGGAPLCREVMGLETEMELFFSRNRTKCEADTDSEVCVDETPLHLAAAMGNVEIVTALLKAPGININCTDRFYKSPLYWAEMAGNSECAELIRTLGGKSGNVCRAMAHGLREAREDSLAFSDLLVMIGLSQLCGIAAGFSACYRLEIDGATSCYIGVVCSAILLVFMLLRVPLFALLNSLRLYYNDENHTRFCDNRRRTSVLSGDSTFCHALHRCVGSRWVPVSARIAYAGVVLLAILVFKFDYVNVVADAQKVAAQQAAAPQVALAGVQPDRATATH